MYENATTLDSDYGDGLRLTSEDTANLRKAGKWGRLLGILSMAFMAISLIFILVFGSTFLAFSGLGEATAGGFVTGMMVFYALVVGFFLYLSYLLYKFGADAVNAVDGGNPRSVTTSLSSLARLFKIYGIISLIYLVFTGLALLGSLASGLGSFL